MDVCFGDHVDGIAILVATKAETQAQVPIPAPVPAAHSAVRAVATMAVEVAFLPSLPIAAVP